MITFIPLDTTNKVLSIINNCIEEMVHHELFYYDLNEDKESQIDYLSTYFPAHLCREETEKCVNVLHDLLEWCQDNYLHDLTCTHEYALYMIFESFFIKKLYFGI